MGKHTLVVIGISIALASQQIAFAYPRQLTDQDIRSAVEYGTSRKGSDLVSDGHPNFIKVPRALAGFIVVYTPWLQIASIAQDAATEYRTLTQDEISRTLSMWQGKLKVVVALVEQREGRWYDGHAVWIQGAKVIQPITKSGHLLRVISCRTNPCFVMGGMIFTFPDDNLDVTSGAEFVIILRGGYAEYRVNVPLGLLR